MKGKKIIDRTSDESKEETLTKGGLGYNLYAILRILFYPGVGFLLMIKLITGIPIGVLQSMFSSE